MRLHIAWQKVTNKNSNELLREFFQKGQHLFNVLPSLSLSTITPVPEIKQKKNPTVIGFVFSVVVEMRWDVANNVCVIAK